MNIVEVVGKIFQESVIRKGTKCISKKILKVKYSKKVFINLVI